MPSLFNLFRKNPLWDFHGGIHPPEMKSQSNQTALSQVPLPEAFIIPLQQHIGDEGELCVAPGEKVLRGQPLTFGDGDMLPVHAPTSGTVVTVAPHTTAHPSGLKKMCLFLTPDGEDRWVTRQPLSDYRQLLQEEIINRIWQAGVAGLGGAGFPTATKLAGGRNNVNTLIINAAECEPYITADDRLIQACAEEIIIGSRILAWALQASNVLIGIENNKTEAIAALKKATGSSTDVKLCVIPTKYPSGGAKQLTKILTGKEVPQGGRSADIGVIMQNAGTAYAVKRAIIDGEALTERVVTLTGEAVATPCNVWGRLGTPIRHLLHHVGYTACDDHNVLMGGPLMGFTLPSLDVPMVKTTNCILAPSANETGPAATEQSCIRCSACADVCPASLLPQQLYWFSRGAEHEKARLYAIEDCIECGACAWVCPSHIPLVQYYRQEKAQLRALDQADKRAAQAKLRFETRQARLEREKQARKTRYEQTKRPPVQNQIHVTDAVQRTETDNTDAAVPHNALPDSEAILLVDETALSRSAKATVSEEQENDPRKTAIAAAIARVKAKKAAQQAQSEAPSATDDTSENSALHQAPVIQPPQNKRNR